MALSPEEENTFRSETEGGWAGGRFETMGAFGSGTEGAFIGIDAYEDQWDEAREDYKTVRVAINLPVGVAEAFANKILEYVEEARR